MFSFGMIFQQSDYFLISVILMLIIKSGGTNYRVVSPFDTHEDWYINFLKGCWVQFTQQQIDNQLELMTQCSPSSLMNWKVKTIKFQWQKIHHMLWITEQRTLKFLRRWCAQMAPERYPNPLTPVCWVHQSSIYCEIHSTGKHAHKCMPWLNSYCGNNSQTHKDLEAWVAELSGGKMSRFMSLWCSA